MLTIKLTDIYTAQFKHYHAAKKSDAKIIRELPEVLIREVLLPRAATECVITVFRSDETCYLKFSGRAYCSQSDEFSEITGIKLSFARAVMKGFRHEVQTRKLLWTSLLHHLTISSIRKRPRPLAGIPPSRLADLFDRIYPLYKRARSYSEPHTVSKGGTK